MTSHTMKVQVPLQAYIFLASCFLLSFSVNAFSSTDASTESTVVSLHEPMSLFLGDEHKSILQKRASWTTGRGARIKGAGRFDQAGVTGVGAMQVSVVDDDHVVIYDKNENNPLMIGKKHASGAIYEISTAKIRALNMLSNSFCAGGGWLSNGTLVSVGGTPFESGIGSTTLNGLQAIRYFTPSDSLGGSDVFEDPANVHMTSARWYPSTVRLEDGSMMVLGGMIASGYNNILATDNPTFEFIPPKFTGQPIWSKFLRNALNSNLFPITYLLPNGLVFVAANQLAMLYDWKTDTEYRLPNLPNGVTVNYPASAAAALLPLTRANNWTPEVFIAGGTAAYLEAEPWRLNAQVPASAQVVRMVLNQAGIKRGWQVESMPSPRIMGDAILTPDGNVFIVNGAESGVAGYGNVKPATRKGASNADNPALAPLLYTPTAPVNKRFISGFPKSTIERLYHSSATLIPDGRIMISGSNPNGNVQNTVEYITRYNVEMFSPPYMTMTRPTLSLIKRRGRNMSLGYGKNLPIRLTIPRRTKVVIAVIMDLGYSTHGVHMNSRHVELIITSAAGSWQVTGPASAGIYPPGYAWLFILADGVPSKGKRIMVGDGRSPPVDQKAIEGVKAYTTKPVSKRHRSQAKL